MLVYYFLIGIPTISYLFLKQKKKHFKNLNNEEFVIVFFFLLYFVLLCLRDTSVGIDVETYLARFFKPYQDYSFAKIRSLSSEWGFGYLTKLITLFTNNPHIYLAIIAAITVLPILYLYKEEATDGLLCISIFIITLLFDMFFSGLRQGLAIAMGVPAFYYSKNKKLLPFALVVILSFSFHRSGILLALIYPAYHAKITKKWLWFVVPLMITIILFNSQIFGFLMSILESGYYGKYVSVSTGYKQTSQYGQLILYCLFSAYSYFVLDECAEESEENIGLRNLLLLATALQCFAPLHVIASRMNFYYMLFIPVTMTRMSTYCKPEYKKLCYVAKAVMILVFVLDFFTRKGDSMSIFNYKFCF